MADSAIEWTDKVWNPTTGCDRVSPGCDNCYALTMAKRLKGMGSPKYQVDGDPRTSGPGFGITMHDDIVGAPFDWIKPRKVFVNSMSDLFHDGVDADHIACVFAVMAGTPRHTYQILTKRHSRPRSLLSSAAFRENVASWLDHWAVEDDVRFEDTAGAVRGAGWPLPNVWLGVSVESQQWADIRIPALLGTPAAVRWISAEPLLGPVNLTPFLHLRPIGENLAMRPLPPDAARALGLPTLDWVVTGGESGPGARPAHPDWFRSLRDQCTSAGVPFHFKQHGEWQPQDVTYRCTHDTPGVGRCAATHSEVMTMRGRGRGCVIEPDGRISAAWSMGGRDYRNDGVTDDGAALLRVGKHAAGRELDGRIHDGYPA